MHFPMLGCSQRGRRRQRAAAPAMGGRGPTLAAAVVAAVLGFQVNARDLTVLTSLFTFQNSTYSIPFPYEL